METSKAALSVLSWNCQLLSPQAQGRKARALAIASRILSLSPRPDVVCLQVRALSALSV